MPEARGAYDGTGNFTKITSLAEMTDGYYVIARVGSTPAMNSLEIDSSADTP